MSYAIAFTVDEEGYRKSGAGAPEVEQLHASIRTALASAGFHFLQPSIYVTKDDDLYALLRVVLELKHIEAFVKYVNAFHAFQLHSWSDAMDLLRFE